ncbi:DUF397 domain-containing protein [Nocardiopsis sp. JB363]|uniref:DUF397 domain-containing protein n=1 Tax=Nocardiopsis sp. JB363 TaxID=1434837 RepID=UPI00190ECB4B|nr:DUF397 domain-containing protein [Nocardiopsis sp. JB363]
MNDSLRWFKSSYSAAVSCCLEAANSEALILVRDSRRPEDDLLVFDGVEWRAFVSSTLR